MTTKADLMKAIRTHCLECMGGSYLDVEKCNARPDSPEPYYRCGLWIYRLGKDPEEPSEAMKAKGMKLQENLRRHLLKCNISK